MSSLKKSPAKSVKYSLYPFLRILKMSGIGKLKPADGILGEITERLQALLCIIGAIYITYQHFTNFQDTFETKTIVTSVVPHIDYFLICVSFFYLYFEGLFSKKNLNYMFDCFEKADVVFDKNFGISFDYKKFEKISTNLSLLFIVITLCKAFEFYTFYNKGWAEKLFVGLHTFSSFLFLVIYGLNMTICWQIKLRFEKLKGYFELLSKNKSLKIRIDKVSKVYIVMYNIIQKTNGNFGFYQLFYIGRRTIIP